MMNNRVYSCRDEKYTSDVGEIEYVPAKWSQPDILISRIKEDIKENRTVMILSSAAYMLEPIITLLRKNGIPFWNPYRFRNGKWNPFGAPSSKRTSTMDRIRTFLAPGHTGEVWNEAQWYQLVELLKATAFQKRGARAMAIKGQINPIEDDLFDEPYYSLNIQHPDGDLLFTADALNAFFDGDLKWLEDNCQNPYKRLVEFASAIKDNNDLQSPRDFDKFIMHNPLVNVGTVHSVKGAEADSVYVFPDFSRTAWHKLEAYYDGSDRNTTLGEMASGRTMSREETMDAAVRTMYVALTRAREKTIICQPAGPRAIEKMRFA